MEANRSVDALANLSLHHDMRTILHDSCPMEVVPSFLSDLLEEVYPFLFGLLGETYPRVFRV